MKRWHLTFGLATVALGAAYFAPHLFAKASSPAPVPPPAPPPAPDVKIAEIVTTPPPLEAVPQGRLVVDAGLDQTAVHSHRTTERYLTITVTAPEVGGEPLRRPVDLSVVMDTSGSMSARGKIDQARRAAKVLANQMQPGDTYSLTVFNDDATVVVPSNPVTNPRDIALAIDRIYEGGGTNLFAGMDRGSREVKRNLRDGAAARVVILSDGKANVGVTDDNALVRFAADLAGDGVALSTIGLGLDYNEDILARLADVGGGTYDFVDNASELESVFSDELQRMAAVVARSTNLELTLPDGVTPIEVIGWDARAVGNGWNVYLGDMYAGETKKIVAKVRIAGAAPGEIAVANASAAYLDVIDQADARSHDDASVLVTDDASVVRASVDRARAIDATRAVGSQFLDMSTRAYARGDRARSAALAGEGTRLLRDKAASLGYDEFEDEARDLEAARSAYEMHTPSSTEGRTLIKVNKERYRALAR